MLNRKKEIILNLIIPLFVSFTFTCAFSQKLPLAKDAQKCFLWEARSQKATAYILGSLHFAKPDLYPLPKIIEDAFLYSDVLVVELDLSKNESFAQATLRREGIHHDDLDLEHDLSPSAMRKVRNYLEKRNIDYDTIRRLKPWFLALNLESECFRRAGYQSYFGLDRYFIRKAVRLRKPIVELETPLQQIGALSNLPKKAQENLLLEVVEDGRKTDETAKEIFDSWKAGDLQVVGRLVRENVARHPEIMKRLFSDRNIIMVDGIKKLLKNGLTCFVVVGAGHLSSEDGILSLLKKDGVVIKQLSITTKIENKKIEP